MRLSEVILPSSHPQVKDKGRNKTPEQTESIPYYQTDVRENF